MNTESFQDWVYEDSFCKSLVFTCHLITSKLVELMWKNELMSKVELRWCILWILFSVLTTIKVRVRVMQAPTKNKQKKENRKICRPKFLN